MGGYSRRCHGGEPQTYLVGSGFDTESAYVGQVVIQRFGVPKTGFGTADAAVSRLYGVAHPLVPFDDGARVEGVGALAAHLVEAIPLLGILIVEGLDKKPGIEGRPAVAGVVNAATVEGDGTAHGVEFGQAVEGEYVGDDPGHDVGDGRTALHVDDRFARDDFMHGFRIGGVGVGSLHAPRRDTVAPGDDGACSPGRFVEYLSGRLSGNGAVARVAQGNGAFDNHDVLAPVGLHGALAHLLGLESAGRHECVGVVERNHFE